MSISINNIRDKVVEALYLERYSQGHKKGCPLSISEIRASMFPPKCVCKEISKDESRNI